MTKGNRDKIESYALSSKHKCRHISKNMKSMYKMPHEKSG